MKYIRLYEDYTGYGRVLPRDFFNEAKLLKCMGRLALKIHEEQIPEGISIEIESNGEPFNIQLNVEGTLCVANYPVKINGKEVWMKTNYNSKLNYPLICDIDGEEPFVFDDNGEFTQDFIKIAMAVRSIE